ncbi:MAG: GIY-YIG nuclease family protein [Acidobacteriia bacterium]|nr:GIY-YIG nuclease family protein [Terriglobia bacterium]
MLTFNAILRHEGIDPKQVRLVRHQDTRPGRITPYNLWRAGGGRLEMYQQIQQRKVFAVGGLLASFVATPANDTLFIGLYCVDGIGNVPPGTIDPSNQAEPGSEFNFYAIRREERLSDYTGHLTIDWGKGFRTWVQRAESNDKAVVEIRTDAREQPFPGFTQFNWDIDQIAAVPLAWQEVLKSVKGVYLLVCKETGKQYVGSAKGSENLWGRFFEYKRTGHGGNVELKRRGRRSYQVTVLEVVNSDSEIGWIENAWKTKLMSKRFGLNKN